MTDDVALMRRTLEATALGIAHRAGPFGALVVDPSGAVIAVAVNDVLVRGDPTAHSEVNAIRRAAAVRRSPFLEGCTLVTTCAPCPMCAGAIHWARLARVVAAARADDAAALGFVNGPPDWDPAAFLRACGIVYDADVERAAAVELLRRYDGPR